MPHKKVFYCGASLKRRSKEKKNPKSKTKRIVQKKNNTSEKINSKDYKECLRYIEKYWKKITCYHPEDKYRHLGLPNRFVSPNDGIYKNDQFYWDSYFIILGLVK